MPAFTDEFVPVGDLGQLVALLPARLSMPDDFRRVVAVTGLPQIDIVVGASVAQERQETLEVVKGQMAQYRMRAVTAGGEVQIKQPQGNPASNTRTGTFFFGTETETDWGTVDSRGLTEFFVLDDAEVFFGNLQAVATTVRVSGFKFFLEDVATWLMLNPLRGHVDAENQIDPRHWIDVNPKDVAAEQIHLLDNFAGIIPTELGRG